MTHSQNNQIDSIHPSDPRFFQLGLALPSEDFPSGILTRAADDYVNEIVRLGGHSRRIDVETLTWPNIHGETSTGPHMMLVALVPKNLEASSFAGAGSLFPVVESLLKTTCQPGVVIKKGHGESEELVMVWRNGVPPSTSTTPTPTKAQSKNELSKISPTEALTVRDAIQRRYDEISSAGVVPQLHSYDLYIARGALEICARIAGSGVPKTWAIPTADGVNDLVLFLNPDEV